MADFSKDSETEITIPVPWGFVQGKTWNSPQGIPVLLVHGHQDNAGSFDGLVPLLPNGFYYVAIDLPGHGRSSHFPKGIPLRVLDFVPTINRVVDYLGWEQFIFIGHSMGGLVGHYYCSFFPDRVTKFVSLEAGVYVFTKESCAAILLSAYTNLQYIEQREVSGKAPEYSYEGALKRLIGGRQVAGNPDFLGEKAAGHLLKRCLVKSGTGYIFSMDQRLKSLEETCLTAEQSIELLKRLKCPMLHVVGTDSLRRHHENWELYEPVRLFVSKHLGGNYNYHIVDGGHSVHMDFPERVSGFVRNFLGTTKASL